VLLCRSFGVLLWEIFSLGYSPYPGRSNEQVMDLVAGGGRLESPPGCPPPIYVIMTSSWNSCPANRPDFSQIISQLRRSIQVDFTVLLCLWNLNYFVIKFTVHEVTTWKSLILWGHLL